MSQEKSNRLIRQQASNRKLKINLKSISASKLRQNFSENLNAITVLNQIGVSNATGSKSKLRSTPSTGIIDSEMSFNSVYGMTTLATSPAELLRKYSTSKDYTCEMDKLFKGLSVTVIQCLQCENLKRCPESFYDRSIPVDTNDESDSSGATWIPKLLKNESYLNGSSKYMCDRCTSKQEAKIYTQYTQTPKILILHLLSYGITSRYL